MKYVAKFKKLNKMKVLSKALLWALISIPISWFGLEAGYALAHGSLLILVPFVITGYLITVSMFEEGQPEYVFEIIFYISQYLSYFLIIYAGMKLKNHFSGKHENT